MSSTSFFLLILLLIVAFYSSSARPIGAINKENGMAKRFHFFSKNEENSSLARVSISSNVKPSISKKSGAAKEGSSLTENRMTKDNKKIRAQKLVEKKHKVKDDHKKLKFGADASQTESLATVTWKLPHPKREEQQPGFNFDYAPPKTHPPVHN